MHEEMWERSRQAFRERLLTDRLAGMGWGELAKKYKMNKSNLRRFILKLLAQEVQDGSVLKLGEPQ